MIKDVTGFLAASAIGFACLGLLALVMARDTIKDVDIGPFDK
tara:strand:- start:152 stop:277 length:126 start_codon:yes stop_codon:yes gene_type:complete